MPYPPAVQVPLSKTITRKDNGQLLFEPSVTPLDVSYLLENNPIYKIDWWQTIDSLPIIDRTEGEKRDTGGRLNPVSRLGARITLPILSIILNRISSTKYNKAIDFLKHYLYGRGEDYQMEVPPDWQQAIASRYPKPGIFKNVSPYNWGMKDLQNSLGHFDLKVVLNKDGSLTYFITDEYKFSVPTKPTERHGFQIPGISEDTAKEIQEYLPSGEYMTKGGFKEKWELKKVNTEWTLFIPQPFLDDYGVNFKVNGNFTITTKYKPDAKSAR